jgi:MoaA/NifB/PqqE/SkfB family radical SAM enzyme
MMCDILREADGELRIVGRHVIPATALPERALPSLREDFLSTQEEEETRQHNLRYANGKWAAPRLLLAWLMLPTRCNQRCRGCYAGNDKRDRGAAMLPFYSDKKFEEILASLKRFGVRTIGYAGLGELFTLRQPIGARQYVDRVLDAGFKMLIFTNGSLLTRGDVEWLAQRPISLIISLRDIWEKEHNRLVGVANFCKSIRAIELAVECGLATETRLGVEIPVLRSNVGRVLEDFIPAMRHLGVVPYAEQYMQVCTSQEEKRMGLSFAEARDFFLQAQAIERKFGYKHEPCFGQRMLSRGKCIRPVFSVTIYPDGSVTPCPGNSYCLGSIFDSSLEHILGSEKYKAWVRGFKLCACSVFYTDNEATIPRDLPAYLEEFRGK